MFWDWMVLECSEETVVWKPKGGLLITDINILYAN